MNRPHHRDDRHVSPNYSAGYSLLEIMVVLALISGALVAFAGLARVPNPDQNLAAFSQTIVAQMRGLRAQAIAQQTTQTFELDAQKRVVLLSVQSKQIALPPDVSAIFSAARINTQRTETGKVLFFHDGSSSGGTLRISNDTRSFAIAVDWLTGSVSLERTSNEKS